MSHHTGTTGTPWPTSEERSSLLGRTLGRYQVLTRLAASGVASVYIARATGVAGFEPLVTIKVLHPHLAHEREFISMFLEEARLAARIRHPNVVSTLDVSDTSSDGCFLVMEHVEGGQLGAILDHEARQRRRLPTSVVLRLVMDALSGLSAAHRLCDDDGQPLHIVHRDVSPHSLRVGVDGVCRLTDFGVAKAQMRLAHMRAWHANGELGNAAREHAATGEADQRADLFGMGVILWEALTGSRLFRGQNVADTLNRILEEPIPAPSSRAADLAPFDALLARALHQEPADRFPTAEAFLTALEGVAGAVGGAASSRVVGEFVESILHEQLALERRCVRGAIDAAARARASVALGATPQDGGAGLAPHDAWRPHGCAAWDPTETLGPGAVVNGRYRIDGLLGEGGNGRVFAATQVVLGRRVALKVLRGALAQTPGNVARFEQEARSASTVGHPNIVDVTDYGTLPDGRPYIVMEHLSGCTLADRLKAGPLPAEEARRIAGEVARALSAAHGRWVIHRDLKPANIFLVDRDEGPPGVKVLDFGIAKDLGGIDCDASGSVLGTPRYMAPEQAEGDRVDGRTDVYALGVTLYEMVAGEPPFSCGSLMRLLHLHRSEPPPPHPLLEREPALDQIVRRALAKEPDDRYASMVEVIQALDRVPRALDAVPSRSPEMPLARSARWIAVALLVCTSLGAASAAALRGALGPELLSVARAVPGSSVAVGAGPPALRGADAPEPTAAEGLPPGAHHTLLLSSPSGAMVERTGATIGKELDVVDPWE